MVRKKKIRIYREFTGELPGFTGNLPGITGNYREITETMLYFHYRGITGRFPGNHRAREMIGFSREFPVFSRECPGMPGKFPGISRESRISCLRPFTECYVILAILMEPYPLLPVFIQFYRFFSEIWTILSFLACFSRLVRRFPVI